MSSGVIMKITAVKSLGIQQTYSPEMKSAQHNYITSTSNAVHKNSHSVSYCLMAFRCLWLKAHFAPEFWAAVMSDCHPDKLVRYMSVARAEDWKPTEITYSGKHKPTEASNGVKFGTLNINNLTVDYTVTGDVVNQGMIGIKKIGDKAAEVFAGRGDYKSIDEFVCSAEGRKNKITLERFIKLGAFSALEGHGNSLALWMWYQYQYCSGNADIRRSIQAQLLAKEGWDEKTIAIERLRQVGEYKKQYPGRKKMPAKFNNWMPKPNDSRDNVMALFTEDFTQAELLEFQKEFLGYYLDSPLDLFQTRGGFTIKDAKSTEYEKYETSLEVMILGVEAATSKPKEGKDPTQYVKLTATDGVQNTIIYIWASELARQDDSVLQPGIGVRIKVVYDKQRGSFAMSRGTNIVRLRLK